MVGRSVRLLEQMRNRCGPRRAALQGLGHSGSDAVTAIAFQEQLEGHGLWTKRLLAVSQRQEQGFGLGQLSEDTLSTVKHSGLGLARQQAVQVFPFFDDLVAVP